MVVPAAPLATSSAGPQSALVRPILLANLVAQVGIIVTGGVVRLTGSGLGCPDWPTCAEGSLVPVASQVEGFHKFIEFGNRLLTFVLVVLALLSFWVVRSRLPRARRLRLLALGIIGGIVLQAVVGGVTVWTELHPITVAFHFVLSIVLTVLATAMWRGASDALTETPYGAEGRSRTRLVPALTTRLAWVTAAVGGLVIVLGTVVTGSGPHSGDLDQPARTGFDPRLVAWLHADAVMLFLGLLVAVLVAVRLARPDGERSADERDEHARLARAWTSVLHLSIVQGVVGYTQFFTGLPIVLVAVHMLLASLLAVLLTLGVMALYRFPLHATATADASADRVSVPR